MKQTYSPVGWGSTHMPSQTTAVQNPPTSREIHLWSASGRGQFLHNLIEMWLKKLNERFN